MLSMTGFYPRSTGIKSDQNVNCATTTLHLSRYFCTPIGPSRQVWDEGVGTYVACDIMT